MNAIYRLRTSYVVFDGSKILTSLAIILPTASTAFAGIWFHYEYLHNQRSTFIRRAIYVQSTRR